MTTSAREYLSVAGRRLECRWVAPPERDAPTIVFLHEGLGSITQWRGFPGELCARARCGGLVYNRQGYGGSDPIDSLPVSFMHHEALEVLPRVLEAFDIAQPVLFGHSDGGSIALIYAGSGQPCTTLILEAPHVFVEELTVASIAALRESYHSTGLDVRLARHHGENVNRLFEAWTSTWLSDEFRDWNIESMLGRVTSPALVIQGRRDQYGTVKQMESIMAAVAGPARSLLLDDCGHAPHLDRAEAVLEACVAFLQRTREVR